MTMTIAPDLKFTRPPITREELWWFVRTIWNVTLPRLQVCPDHVSPFDAFAEAYFGNRNRWVLWYGSRGSGKSLMLATLALTKAAAMDMNVVLLGGSMSQSNNVHEHVATLMRSPNAPVDTVERNIKTELSFQIGNWVRPIPASQTTVRGPHPHLLCLDEIDEMERAIYDAAMGQAMTRENARGIVVPEMTVASSTWQHPQGCLDSSARITTLRGEVTIPNVVVGDQVFTRSGWRSVAAVHDMGFQPVVTVHMSSGADLTCTPWHPFWVEGSGWVRADALLPGASCVRLGSFTRATTKVPFSTFAEPISDVAVGAELPGLGVGLADQRGTSVVLNQSDRFQVLGVDARLDSTQVVDDPAIGDGADSQFVHPAMSQVSAFAESRTTLVLEPVPGVVDDQGPDDAVIGRKVDGHIFEPDEVVSVIHTQIVVPTWDLTVEGMPEYVANGVLVHNTFSEVRDEALVRGLPVRTWCWKETLKTEENPYGWLEPDFIERKRASVPAEMFRVEYELGEPAGDARAFDLEKLNQACVEMPTVDETHKGHDDTWVFEQPIRTCSYAAGADWAKEKDMTVIVVVRTDIKPHPVVYLRRMNRKPWPEMIEAFNKVTAQYQAVSAHDGTGIGNVVNDMIDERTVKVVMVGRDRTLLLTEYVAAVENQVYKLPRNTPLHMSHRAATVDDLYATSVGTRYHLPDDVAAMAICHRAVTRQAPPAPPGTVPQTAYAPKMFQALRPETDEAVWDTTKEGVVHIKDTEDTAVFWL